MEQLIYRRRRLEKINRSVSYVLMSQILLHEYGEVLRQLRSSRCGVRSYRRGCDFQATSLWHSRFHLLIVATVCFVLSATSAVAANRETQAKDIVQKSKADRCPAGYRISGNYCEAYRPGTHAIKKKGHCPSGYHISGTYCIKN